jgi:hypothetical protein
MPNEEDSPQVGSIYKSVRDQFMDDIKKWYRMSSQQTHLWDDKEDREGFVIRWPTLMVMVT